MSKVPWIIVPLSRIASSLITRIVTRVAVLVVTTAAVQKFQDLNACALHRCSKYLIWQNYYWRKTQYSLSAHKAKELCMTD